MTTHLNPASHKPILVVGGTGKTGRRVGERLAARDVPVRIGSRSANPSFDWEHPDTWSGALDGVHAVYVTYYPDLLMPEAVERIGAFATLAVENGARRLVLLSGRGEEAAERCEAALKASGADWTVIRASWFAQNFSESFLVEPMMAGEVALPVGDIGEPFIDVDDIAAVAVEALTDDRYIGRTVELTGPRLITFREAVGEIARATRRDIRYVQVTAKEFGAGLSRSGLPDDYHALVSELFTEVMDGRNQYLTDEVERVTGRPPRDFADYVREVAEQGAWRVA